MKILRKKTVGTLAGALVVSLAAFPALAKDESKSTAVEHGTIDAKTFLKYAASDNEAEITFADLALSKAQNQEVKTFAQSLKSDHIQARAEITPLAQKYGVDVQDSKKNATNKLSSLQGVSGTEFDKKFAEGALKCHQKDLAMYKKASQQLQEQDVKDFAQKILPKLQSHQQQASRVAQTVGVDQSTISAMMKESPEAVGGTSDEADVDRSSSSSSKEADEKTTQGTGGKALKEGSEPVK
jgi:putative membrane protein